MDRCVRLLASGNPQFVDYLIANPDGSLFKTVVHGISLEMDMFGTSLDAEKEKIGANLITDSQRKLFDKIFEDIDSLMKN